MTKRSGSKSNRVSLLLIYYIIIPNYFSSSIHSRCLPNCESSFVCIPTCRKFINVCYLPHWDQGSCKDPFSICAEQFLQYGIVCPFNSYKVSFRRALLGLVSDAFFFSPASNTQPRSEVTEKTLRSVRDTIFWIVK